jgi:hypothetical protein
MSGDPSGFCVARPGRRPEAQLESRVQRLRAGPAARAGFRRRPAARRPAPARRSPRLTGPARSALRRCPRRCPGSRPGHGQRRGRRRPSSAGRRPACSSHSQACRRPSTAIGRPRTPSKGFPVARRRPRRPSPPKASVPLTCGHVQQVRHWGAVPRTRRKLSRSKRQIAGQPIQQMRRDRGRAGSSARPSPSQPRLRKPCRSPATGGEKPAAANSRPLGPSSRRARPARRTWPASRRRLRGRETCAAPGSASPARPGLARRAIGRPKGRAEASKDRADQITDPPVQARAGALSPSVGVSKAVTTRRACPPAFRWADRPAAPALRRGLENRSPVARYAASIQEVADRAERTARQAGPFVDHRERRPARQDLEPQAAGQPQLPGERRPHRPQRQGWRRAPAPTATIAARPVPMLRKPNTRGGAVQVQRAAASKAASG